MIWCCFVRFQLEFCVFSFKTLSFNARFCAFLGSQVIEKVKGGRVSTEKAGRRDYRTERN